MMTAEQLKSSILQLAMQGKLVPQDPDDEPASVLLKKMTEEKNRLIKEGKIKKQKPLPEINEEEIPFDIPRSWEWVRLDNVVSKTIKRGKSPKYSQKSNTLVFAQKCNTKAGNIDLSLCLFLEESQLSKYPEEEFMIDNDIIINSTGNGTLGRVGIYRDSDNPNHLDIVPDSHVTIIRSSNYMNSLYAFYCLKFYQPFMERLGSGSTNQTELNSATIQELLFPLPPLEEQKRIVSKIEELMPFVEQYAATSTKLNTLNISFPDQMKKSILQEAMQGKLVPQDPNDEPASVLLKKISEEKNRLIKEGKIKKQKPLPEIKEEEIPFDIPESWEWVKFGSVIKLLSGADLTPNKYNSDEKGIAYITGASNINNGKIVVNRWTEYPNNIAYKGELLLTCKGTVGKTAILDLNKAHIARQIMTISPIICSVDYLNIYVQSIVNNLKKKAKSMIPGIERENILNSSFPLPPLEEQKRIVAKIEEMMAVIDNLSN